MDTGYEAGKRLARLESAARKGPASKTGPFADQAPSPDQFNLSSLLSRFLSPGSQTTPATASLSGGERTALSPEIDMQFKYPATAAMAMRDPNVAQTVAQLTQMLQYARTEEERQRIRLQIEQLLGQH